MADTWTEMAKRECVSDLTPGPEVPHLGNEISQLKLGISAAVEELYEAWKQGGNIQTPLGVLMKLQGELETKKGNEHGGE